LQYDPEPRRRQSVSHIRHDAIERRRAKIIELLSKGKNHSQIAEELDVDVSTVSRDYQYIQENARKTLNKYATEVIPLELMKCIARLNAISNEAWTIFDRVDSDKERVPALSLAMRAAVQLVNILTSYRNSVQESELQEPVQESKEEKSTGKKSTEPDPAETVF
jgi:orotate phosphoribosyltransferase-like protein